MNKTSRILSLLVVGALALLVLGAAYAATKHKAAPKAQKASSVAEQLQQEYEGVVNAVEPSVVQIQTSEGLGSGIVFDSKGDIVTNNHVVGTAKTFKVTLASGKQVSGTLVGTFAPDDLAVIHVDAPGLKAARFADSSKLQVGQIALAVGNPLGFRSSVTDGIVSALGRTVSEPGGATLPNVIQTSAAINPGNSGGALVDLDGAVIGIPTLGVSDPQMGGAASGIGFAIPSSTVSDIAGQLVSKRQGHQLAPRVPRRPRRRHHRRQGRPRRLRHRRRPGRDRGHRRRRDDRQRRRPEDRDDLRPRRPPGRPQARAEGVDRARPPERHARHGLRDAGRVPRLAE